MKSSFKMRRWIGCRISRLAPTVALLLLAACGERSGFATQTSSSSHLGWSQSFPGISSIEPSASVSMPDPNTITCSGRCSVQFDAQPFAANNRIECMGEMTITESVLVCDNDLTVSNVD